MSDPVLSIYRQTWKLRQPFRIARGVKTHAETIIVEINDGTFKGQAECTPYARYGESLDSVMSQLLTLKNDPAVFTSSQAIQEALPAGAARNALDCAQIDFQAKRDGVPAAIRLGVQLKPLDTAYTLSLDDPEQMYEAATFARRRPILKIKLGGDGDHDRLAAVRKGAPNSKLIVDANEGWSEDNLERHLSVCVDNQVDLIEQPLPVGKDEILRGLKSPIPLCADESLHTRKDLDDVAKCYDAINIKLDKAGGLTEALALKKEAEERGLTIMVGCMVASSLAMAPALVLAQGANWVDLDGPLLLAEDHEDALHFKGSELQPPSPSLWG